MARQASGNGADGDGDYNVAMAAPRDRDEPHEAIDAVLQITPVFRKLAADDRLTVAAVAAIRRYNKGELIFDQGAPSDDFYTIA